ncbi:MAG: NUDIX domain-containing protein [Candidatus Bruticola sp.]
MTQGLVIHTCGTARNNPGSAGVGLVIERPDSHQILISENIGIATTAQAQYQAVIMALIWASEHGYNQLSIFLDNAKMIRALLHNPTVSDLRVLGLHKRARRLLRSLKVNFSLYDSMSPHKVITLALEASLRTPADSTVVHENEETKDVKNHHAIQQSAGGVIYKREGDKVKVCLIAKKGGAVWALPKGRVQSGETWEMTATREVLEETGHLATIAERIDQIEYYFYWRDNRTLYYKLVTFFLMPLIQENAAIPDGEASEVAWFDLGEAWRKLYYQSEKNILQQAKQILHAAKII